MKPTYYYTVIAHRNFFTVKYAIVPVCEIFTFPGLFDDPGEASQAFQKVKQGNLEYLKEGPFQRKVDDLHTRHKQDLAKLADWNRGRKGTI